MSLKTREKLLVRRRFCNAVISAIQHRRAPIFLPFLRHMKAINLLYKINLLTLAEFRGKT
jgi:hypothetical protein